MARREKDRFDQPRHKKELQPHTSEDKARLCDGLRPVLRDFHDTIHALSMKWPDRRAGDSVIAMAEMLGAELRRLLRGEPVPFYAERIHLPSHSLASQNIPTHRHPRT